MADPGILCREATALLKRSTAAAGISTLGNDEFVEFMLMCLGRIVGAKVVVAARSIRTDHSLIEPCACRIPDLFCLDRISQNFQSHKSKIVSRVA